MSLPSIDLSIAERLRRDPEFRRHFFVAETSAQIARQLIALRKLRKLNQAQLAENLDTKQPAISRVESADYRHWSYDGLRKHTEALDGRLRVIIEPAEKAILEYERLENESAEESAEIAPETNAATLIQNASAVASVDSARLNALVTVASSDVLNGVSRLTARANIPAPPRLTSCVGLSLNMTAWFCGFHRRAVVSP